MRKFLERFKHITNGRRDLILNYSGDINDPSIKTLEGLLRRGNESGELSNHQSGINNKYINIIVISDAENIPDLIKHIKKL